MTSQQPNRTRKTPKKKLKMSKTYEANYLATLKFNILERLQRRDTLYRNKVFCLVLNETQRNESTVRRVLHRKKADDKPTDVTILYAFAKIFRVQIEDLHNPII